MDWLDDALDDAGETFTKAWTKFCDFVAKQGSGGKWIADHFLRRLVVASPVLFGFVLACGWTFVAQQLFPGLERSLGVHDSWNWSRMPLQLTSLVTHIFAHCK